MADIGLLQAARSLGAKSVLAMAGKLGVKAPPPPISVRALLRLFGSPLQPTDLKLSWDIDPAGKPIFHAPDEQEIPFNKTIEFHWRDPGDSSVRKATNFQLQIKVATTGQEFWLSPFRVLPPPGFGATGFKPNTRYSWNVVPINDFGQGPSSPVFTFGSSPAPTPTPPPIPKPPPTPTPTPANKTLTLSILISSFGQEREIKSVVMTMTGPGAPTGNIPFQVSSLGANATALVPLPPPSSGQSSTSYTIQGLAAIHYDGLINPNSGEISGAEDTTVQAKPVTIPWTGQNRTARFSINYDGFQDAFSMSFDGLF